jgi:hypothetical protein
MHAVCGQSFWSNTYVWVVDRKLSLHKNGYSRDMCYDKIGLCAHNMYMPIAKFSGNDNNFEDENSRNIYTVNFYF